MAMSQQRRYKYCVFLKPPDSEHYWKVRKHGAFSFPRQTLGLRPTDQSCHHEVWLHIDLVGWSNRDEPDQRIRLKERKRKISEIERLLVLFPLHDQARTFFATAERDMQTCCEQPALRLKREADVKTAQRAECSGTSSAPSLPAVKKG